MTMWHALETVRNVETTGSTARSRTTRHQPMFHGETELLAQPADTADPVSLIQADVMEMSAVSPRVS